MRSKIQISSQARHLFESDAVAVRFLDFRDEARGLMSLKEESKGKEKCRVRSDVA